MKDANHSSASGGNLPKWLWARLDLYCLAATAAGATSIMAAHPAQAEIVYTPVNQSIDRNMSFSLDLNRDGIPDFQLWNEYSFGIAIEAKLGIKPMLPNNRIAGNSEFAAALPGGVSIGGNARFPKKGDGVMVWFIYSFSTTQLFSSGPWRNVKDRYLGLKFSIDGQTHYGWARLNVSFRDLNIAATLTGYAYETDADKPIDAGQTKETAVLPPLSQRPSGMHDEKSQSPSALGMLARGSGALPIWHRNDGFFQP